MLNKGNEFEPEDNSLGQYSTTNNEPKVRGEKTSKNLTAADRDPPEGFIRFRPSKFAGLPSTIFFEYVNCNISHNSREIYMYRYWL